MTHNTSRKRKEHPIAEPESRFRGFKKTSTERAKARESRNRERTAAIRADIEKVIPLLLFLSSFANMNR